MGLKRSGEFENFALIAMFNSSALEARLGGEPSRRLCITMRMTKGISCSMQKKKHASQKSPNHRMRTTNLSMRPQQPTNASRVFSRSDARLWAKEIEPLAQIALERLHLLISISNWKMFTVRKWMRGGTRYSITQQKTAIARRKRSERKVSQP